MAARSEYAWNAIQDATKPIGFDGLLVTGQRAEVQRS
jgi:hypothetical protein